MKKFVAGFDPGGRGNFGWCVVALDSWHVVGKGVVNYAPEAFEKMQQAMSGEKLSAVGIDAPLYWSKKDDSRESDNYVRTHYSKEGVLTVNTLQGACLAQGCMLAKKIESEYENCLITETHPKALLKALRKLKICSNVGKWSDETNNGHERDALVSAWAAAQALRGNGQNLFCRENAEDIHVFLKKTMYWWPN